MNASIKENAISSDIVPNKFQYVKTNFTTIVDLDMPFLSMVFFYLKWSFAVVPTAILWCAIYYFILKEIIEFIK